MTVSPFWGIRYVPNKLFFLQGFVAATLPMGENNVSFSEDNTIDPPTTASGGLEEQSTLQGDVALGCWLYRRPCGGFIEGVAPVVEVHYTTNLSPGETIFLNDIDGTSSVSQLENFDFVNMTAGTLIQFQSSSLNIGFVFPLTSGLNRQFDFEAVVQLTAHF
jgi:hypothetical protein